AQPISNDDELIYKALGGANSSFLEFIQAAGVQGAPQQTRSPGMIVGAAFAILFAFIITTARLWVRKFYLRAFGVDDILIIPAAVGCVTYLCVEIVQEVAGCVGQHIYAFDLYTLYALDTVDIFFATIVASLPALNGIFDQAIKNVSKIGSDIGVGMILRLRSLVPTEWTTRDDSAKVPMKTEAKQ
ncbi:MAG: hypothetical protein Q9191_004401, partial [Dirinaria sp. TL-2023a]